MRSIQNLFETIKQRIHSIIKDQNIKSFFNNLGIVFIFRFTSAVLNLIAMVLAARFLGVVAVGDIVTIQSTACFLIIPIVLGINFSIIKYLPESDKEQRRKLIGSAFVWNLILTAFFVLIYIIFTGSFSKITNLSLIKWKLSVILAVAINFSMVLESILRARKRFLTIGIIKIIGASAFFVIVLISIAKSQNYYYFIVGLITNYAIIAILAFKDIGEKKIGFSFKTSKLIYGYGAINMASWILSTTLFSSDLFIVNHFCSGYDVGMYSVYQVNVRNFFGIMFHEIFAVVFLPTIVQMDKVKIYKRIISLIPLLLPFAVLANVSMSVVMLLMYGKDYKINWIYLLMVSLGTGLHFIYWMFNSVFTVEGKKGALLCLLVLGIPLPVLLAVSIFLTKAFGITGTMVSWLVTQLVLIGMFLLIIKYRYLNKQVKQIAGYETPT